jgi:hypothetical protein
MKQEIISRFNEAPKTRTAWWAMGLGLSTVLIHPLLGIFTAVIRPIIDPASMVGRESSGIVGATMGSMGFGSGVVALILSVSTIVTGVRAFKKGERSWVLWVVGFVPAILVGAFWVFMFIGEFIFPH